MTTTLLFGPSFKDNLARLPAIDGVARIDLFDANGTLAGSIANQPGQQGSLAVYQYLKTRFATLDAQAAELGLEIFAEHTPARAPRPAPTPISTA
jgi:hypothetical protein